MICWSAHISTCRDTGCHRGGCRVGGRWRGHHPLSSGTGCWLGPGRKSGRGGTLWERILMNNVVDIPTVIRRQDRTANFDSCHACSL